MTRVQVWIEIPDDELPALEHEAERENRTVETLVEQIVQGLWEEMRREEEEGTDHDIFPS
ncbi:MAG: hypothetical protein IPM29_16305 [Planctomycetes bacterium]|nr:hypothetical protein [Planctomycetota bacterium]